MKNKLIISILVGLIISGCCRKDSVEIARYELSSDELKIIPYELGEKINFIHSNGYSFDFNVVEDKIEWKEYHDFCEYNCCGQDYFSYQVRTTIIESSYPRFNIELSLGGSRIYEYIPKSLNIEINYDYFARLPYNDSMNFICDSTTNTTFFETIILNGKSYTNVTKKLLDTQYIIDTQILMPKAIYYNELGIIQIETTNNETYTINN
ncbi:MAG: hypothetical protein LBQ22_02785 [Bacteroidales bacterium]|jgi:hypothetical protein|nr:hypothetical protein [Bacteroidales bacterium]